MHSLLDAFGRKKTRLRYHVFEYFGVFFSIDFVVLVSRTRRNLLETGLNTVNCVAKCEISKFAFCILAQRLYITIPPKNLMIVCVRSKFFIGKNHFKFTQKPTGPLEVWDVPITHINSFGYNLNSDF